MGARHFTQLVTWQLADDVRRLVFAFTARPPCSNDRKFCGDARAAAESAPANTCEGFSRFNPKEFVVFLRYARASLSETQDHLISALHSKYVDEAKFHEIWRLSVRAIKANEALQKYLHDCIKSGFRPDFW
jgi:four helix bundle protein